MTNSDGIIEAGAEIGKDEIETLLPQVKQLVERGYTVIQALRGMGKKSCCTKELPVKRRLLEKYGVSIRMQLIRNDIQKNMTGISESDRRVIAAELREYAAELQDE